MPDVTLTQRDKGKSVTVGPSDNLQIAVNENPGTGFRWTAEVADNGTLEVLSADYTPATSPTPGGSGQHVWRFKAKSPGDVRLLLKQGMTREFKLPHPSRDGDDDHRVEGTARRRTTRSQQTPTFNVAQIAHATARLSGLAHLAYRVVVAPAPIVDREREDVGERRQVANDGRWPAKPSRTSRVGRIAIDGVVCRRSRACAIRVALTADRGRLPSSCRHQNCAIGEPVVARATCCRIVFIGAHAAVERCPLLTRDVQRYRPYFPTVELIAP